MVLITLKLWVLLTLHLGCLNKQGFVRMARVLLKLLQIKETAPGVVMKKVIQPLAWFVVLTSVLALASGVSLGLV